MKSVRPSIPNQTKPDMSELRVELDLNEVSVQNDWDQSSELHSKGKASSVCLKIAKCL